MTLTTSASTDTNTYPLTFSWQEQLSNFVQYWDNFNLSLLLVLVLATMWMVGLLAKQPVHVIDKLVKQLKFKAVKLGWRLLFASFLLNLFVSIWS